MSKPGRAWTVIESQGFLLRSLVDYEVGENTFPDAFVVIDEERVAFRVAQATLDARELREGLAALGFIVGRNPDGVDDMVPATLLILRELYEERNTAVTALKRIARLPMPGPAGECKPEECAACIAGEALGWPIEVKQ